jgi:hypothetical protein
VSPTFFTVGVSAPSTKSPFGKAINLSNDTGDAVFPMVATSQGNVYVVWSEGKGGILFRASHDEASTWNPPLSKAALKLSNGSGTTQFPVIAANGSNVYVAWPQNNGAGLQIMFVVSTNNGSTFSSPIQLTRASSNVGAITPSIAGWGNDVYVAYASGGVSYVNASQNAGANWTHGFIISKHAEPQLAAYGTNAYAISDDAGPAVTNDSGKDWYYPKCCSPVGVQSEPWIAAYGSNVYIASESKGSSSKVFAEYSTNGGKNWSSSIILTKNYPDAWAPMVSAYGNTVYVAFHTYPGSSRAREYVMFSTNDWVTNITTLLSSKRQDASFPLNVAVQGNYAFVMWDQQVNRTTNTWNAKVAMSTNAGVTWNNAPPAYDLSNSGINSQMSPENDIAPGSIASYGNLAFAAWQNASVSAAYSQIYFSSG